MKLLAATFLVFALGLVLFVGRFGFVDFSKPPLFISFALIQPLHLFDKINKTYIGEEKGFVVPFSSHKTRQISDKFINREVTEGKPNRSFTTGFV